jgi:hypothetical protein
VLAAGSVTLLHTRNTSRRHTAGAEDLHLATVPTYLVLWIRCARSKSRTAHSCIAVVTGSCAPNASKAVLAVASPLPGGEGGGGTRKVILRSFTLGVGTVVAQSVWRLDYGLNDRGIGARIPVEAKGFSLLHIVQTGCGAHSASYTMGTGSCFLGGKAAGV